MTMSRWFMLGFLPVFFACLLARTTIQVVEIQQTQVTGCASYEVSKMQRGEC